ncbi:MULTISPECIES: amidohydrolase family protein [Thermocrispum]|uniref:amidohydrolase family protein n=1 Tax=Thermocrispum TaxID=37924 RepID=UPI0003FF0F45|nr:MULTISPECIES: amidohydrolase family protein [Thermocrispum]
MRFGPASDGVIAGWARELGLPGLVDIHVHFLPQRVMRKVWAYFDEAERHYGVSWPVWYRHTEQRRLAMLRQFGVERFAPLVYPHKPGMARWLNEWVRQFAEEVPDAVPTATLYPEPDVSGYVEEAVRAGARCVKVHVQVGAFDPRDPVLDPAWGMLADAGVPVVVHCGHGPLRGEYTGVDVFAEVLAKHPRLTAVLAHAGMPEFDRALALLERYPRVYLDTTMVGTPFSERLMKLPADWAARLADVPHRVALGTDFPNIPYPYATQLRAIAQWADADERLGEPFLRAVLYETPKALLNGARGR